MFSLIDEVRRQRAVLSIDRREPAVLQVGPSAYRALLCCASTLVTERGVRLYDMTVERVDREMVRVLPADWRGEAQGAARV